MSREYLTHHTKSTHHIIPDWANNSFYGNKKQITMPTGLIFQKININLYGNIRFIYHI